MAAAPTFCPRKGLAMAESVAERVLRYRNSAQSVANGTERETLLRLAGEFDSLADEIERSSKPPKPSKKAL